jgi:hypothetical protein
MRCKLQSHYFILKQICSRFLSSAIFILNLKLSTQSLLLHLFVMPIMWMNMLFHFFFHLVPFSSCFFFILFLFHRVHGFFAFSFASLVGGQNKWIAWQTHTFSNMNRIVFFPHLEQACLKLNFNRDAAESSFVVSREKKRN